VASDGSLVKGKGIFVKEEVSWESLVAYFDLLEGLNSGPGSLIWRRVDNAPLGCEYIVCVGSIHDLL
jgi:hypothetical protein